MADLSWSVGIPGFVKLEVGPEATRALGQAWRKRTKISGVCIIVDRWSGLALDSTTHPTRSTRPVLWTLHSEPWQRWRFVRLVDDRYLVVSEHCGLVLTTDAAPDNYSWVTLDSYRGHAQQQWKLIPTDDGVAYQIESVISAHTLDAGKDPHLPASGDNHSIGNPSSPHMWQNYNGFCQQWTIARLP